MNSVLAEAMAEKIVFYCLVCSTSFLVMLE